MKQRFVTFSVLACYFLSSLVFSMFLFSPNTPPVLAAEENKLQLMGDNCGNFKGETNFSGQITGQQKNCFGYEAYLEEGDDEHIGCSGNMFYRIPDPNGSGAKINVWYTDADKYADCYVSAKSKLNELNSDKCKKLKKGEGEWDSCEKVQRALFLGMGCSNRMFEDPDGDNYFVLGSSKIEDCKNRLNNAGEARVLLPDGTRAKPANQSDAAQAGGGAAGNEEEKVDCDTKLNSVLSWIACPLIDQGVNLSDFVYKDVVEPMLEDVPVSTNPKDPSYIAWQQFRLLANVLLVGTLLVVVYSQAKGGGDGR